MLVRGTENHILLDIDSNRTFVNEELTYLEGKDYVKQKYKIWTITKLGRKFLEEWPYEEENRKKKEAAILRDEKAITDHMKDERKSWKWGRISVAVTVIIAAITYWKEIVDFVMTCVSLVK